MTDSIGKRIARLRQERGWTQQDLANQLAISRVAVSHIEMDLSVPGERTITLLAGMFKLTPHALVENTNYPPAKAERLPGSACSYTPLELDLALLNSDLEWLQRLNEADSAQRARLEAMVWEKWQPCMERWTLECSETLEKERLAKTWQALVQACQRR